jgi:hypothetical protein
MARFRKFILQVLDRVPDTNQFLPVYGLIVMLVYGWSLYQFIWNLPSWLKFLTLGEIGSVLAYTIVTDLAESLLILMGLIIVSVILPKKWFRDDFIVRGGGSVLYLLILFMVIARNTTPYEQLVSKYAIRGLIDFSFLQLMLGEIRLLRKIVSELADRSTIFLYLSIPSSALALIVVLIRSI